MARGSEQDFRVDGQVAVVTGGGAGIGEGICTTLARAGAAVVVVDVNRDSAERVAQSIREGGGRAVAVAGDVGNRATIDGMLGRACGEFGHLDILVNNAAIVTLCDFLDIPLEVWDQTFNVNLRAIFQSMQAAGKIMREQGSGGAIVSIASAQGLRPIAAGLTRNSTRRPISTGLPARPNGVRET